MRVERKYLPGTRTSIDGQRDTKKTNKKTTRTKTTTTTTATERAGPKPSQHTAQAGAYQLPRVR